MNRIHKIIWSALREKWIVVSEKAGASGCPIIQRGGLSIAAFIAMTNAALAISPTELPTGGAITAGSGSISTSANAMTVNQTSQKMVADWNTFNIGEQASVTFRQPGATASALNRIHDLDPSQIMGKLSANGQVFLINQSGIIFGKTAQVNVGGIVATSLDMADSDYLAGKYRFSATGIAGSVINEGVIEAMPGGVVALIAPRVENEGAIRANGGGSAALLAGDKVTVDFGGDGLINYVIDQGAVEAQAANKGLIQADGGLAVMSARAANELTGAAVNNTGIVRARTLASKEGRIVLISDMKTGTTTVRGTLDASAPNGGDGGFIETSGAKVKVAEGTKIDTRAAYGKTGEWLIDPTDFTISSGSAALTTSGIGATTLSSNLATTDVTLQTSASGIGNGDIFVNDTVSWSANTLTLDAHRNITVNSAMNASGTSSLALKYGQGSTDGVISGTKALFTVNAPINLASTSHFTTQLGSLVANKIDYTIISNLAQLQGMSLTGNYVLGANIDGAGGAFTPIGGWISDTAYATAKNSGDLYSTLSSNMFTGMFEGAGHTISNLTISGAGNSVVGLFDGAYSASSQTIENLHLSGVNVSGDIRVGALAGVIGPKTTVYNVSVTGSSVTGMSNVGGFAGISLGAITSSTATENTVAQSGSNGAFTALQSTLGIFENYGNVGGFLGRLDGGTVSGSSSSGSVTAAASSIDIGGFAGYITSGSISQSYSTVNVTSDSNSSNIGGFVGYVEAGSVSQSYSTGLVTAGTGSSGIGGFAGFNGGTIQTSYWDTTTSGQSMSAGGEGKTTAELSVSLPTGFDPMVWGNADNQTTPYLLSHSAFSHTSGTVILGTDTSATPTYYSVILNVTQLQNISDGLAGNYVLGANIDASATSGWNGGLGFSPIGPDDITQFTGTFDGLGHTITGLTINSTSQNYVGLFGYVGSGGAISNVGLVGGSVSSNEFGWAIGGLVGFNDGTVTQSYATGAVSGSDMGWAIGGLVGYNNNGMVTSSYATGAVSGGSSDIGGLVGWNLGTVTSSYATGTVSGGLGLGGLVGFNKGTITESYATGAVLGDSILGGLVGESSGTIIQCHATGAVSGSATGWTIGGLVGSIFDGTVTQSYATGAVSGDSEVGGLAGESSGTIVQSYATGAVSGTSQVGGLVGANTINVETLATYGLIDQSYATGAVSGDVEVGGLVGANSGMVIQSYATGAVSGSSQVGGLVGSIFDGTVTQSYATGAVSGDSEVGGLAGESSGTIVQSYATGAVSGTSQVGGLVGANTMDISDGMETRTYYGSIDQSYATGAVSGTSNVGGLLGFNGDASVSSSYWDTTTSGQALSAGGTGKTTAEMKSLATYAGWDISATGGDGKSWRIYEGQTTPLLRTFLTPLTVTGLSATTPVTYDGLSHAMPVSGTPVFAGFVGSDTSASLGQSQYKNVGTYEPWYSYKYDIILTGGNGTLTITPATLTYVSNASSRIYGDANPLFSGTITGWKNGEIQASVTTGTLSWNTTASAASNVGSYGITGSGLVANHGNYEFAQAVGNSTALTVNPAPLTYVSNASSRIYGDANPLFSGTIMGWKNGETQASATTGTLSWSTTASETSNVGSYEITGSGLEANNGNYVFDQGVGNSTALTVNPAPLTYVSNASSRIYGDANPLFSGTITGWKNGETQASATTGTASWSTTASETSNVGSYEITGSGLVANHGNYEFAQSSSNSTALTITPAPLTITANNDSKTYDGQAYSGGNGVSYSGFVNGETSSVLGGTVSYTGNSKDAVNAGSYSITASGLTSSNYAISYVNGTLTVNKAPLTVTANDFSKEYDNVPYSGGNGVTYSGFVNGESAGVLDGELTYGGSSRRAVNPGTYSIDPSGLTSDNYAITYVPGYLTINMTPLPPPDPRPDSNDKQEVVITTLDIAGAAGLGCMEMHVVTNSRGGSIRVYVHSMRGELSGGFTLSLPPGVIDPDQPVTITLPDGSPLPSWFTFDPVASTFTASDVPAGIQSLNIVISQGKQTWLLQIAATTPGKTT